MKAYFAALAFAWAMIASTAAFAQADDGTPTDGTTPSVEGSFDALSPGNQKIVKAIHESQIGSRNEMNGGTLLSRDEIAAMKAGTGWGKLYKHLYQQGYTTERNLGQAVSKYNHLPPPAPETGVVITTGSGASFSAGGSRKGHAGGAKGAKGKDFTLSGTDGGVTSGAGRGHGRALGHARQTVITSGAGAAITAGTAGHSSAGGRGHGRGGAKKLK